MRNSTPSNASFPNMTWNICNEKKIQLKLTSRLNTIKIYLCICVCLTVRDKEGNKLEFGRRLTIFSLPLLVFFYLLSSYSSFPFPHSLIYSILFFTLIFYYCCKIQTRNMCIRRGDRRRENKKSIKIIWAFEKFQNISEWEKYKNPYDYRM